MSNIHEKFSYFVIECQFIEEQLRKGILLCTNEIKLSLVKFNSKIVYNISNEELRYLSMKELIKRFDKFTEDKNLIKDLYNLAKIRNISVHKEFLILGERKNFVKDYLQEGEDRLNTATIIAEDCFKRLTNLILGYNSKT